MFFLFAGETARVILTVAGDEKINRSTLALDLLSEDGKRLGSAIVSPGRTSGAHFTASFNPPSVPFTLKLKGKTKKGYNFERLSHNVVQPSLFIIRVLYASNEYTIPAGGRTFVMFRVHNNGPPDSFDIRVKDNLNYFQYLRGSPVSVRKRSRGFFSFIMRAPASAPRGKGDEVVVSATSRKSKKTVSQVVRLMVV